MNKSEDIVVVVFSMSTRTSCDFVSKSPTLDEILYTQPEITG